MKTKTTKLITCVALIGIVVGSIMQVQHSQSYPTGAPSGTANDPLGGVVNCTDCHSGGVKTVAGYITSNIPAAGYTPGTTYTINAKVRSIGKTIFGFEISPQTAAGVKKGTLIAGTGSKILSGGNYITHTAGIVANDSASWSFQWTAPAAGTGAVNFYGSFLGGNNNGGTSGDSTILSTTTVNEAPACSVTASISAASDTVCNGATTTLTASGNGTYTWSTGATTASITAGPGTYTVTVTNSATCTKTATKTIINKVVSANITSASDTICPQDSIILTASGGNSYLWSTGATTTTVYAKAGTYTVTASNGTCASSKSKSIIGRNKIAPGNITSTKVYGTTAQVNWSRTQCASGYRIQYRPVGTTTWKTVSVGDTINKNLTGLTPLTQYQYRIASLYGSLVSAYSTIYNFTTLCNCSKPVVTVSVLSNSSVKFSWVDDSCSVKHRIQYRVNGTTAWTTKISVDNTNSTSSVTVTGLLPNTIYQYQTRTDCSADGLFNSGYNAIGTFTTPLRIGDNESEGLSSLLIYPNPSKGNVNISIPSSGDIYINNVLGEEVSAFSVVEKTEKSLVFKAGFYIVHFKDSETGVILTSKFQVTE